MPAVILPSQRIIGVLPALLAVNRATVYLVLGLLGVLPLVLLTPPFQVPDEPQHFFRAYQLSELNLFGEVRDNAAGALLPSSLPELSERFLRTREILTDRPVRPTPLAETLGELTIPLDPARREFVDFSGSETSAPLAYLPQAAGIAAGRALGLGPLGLLYTARLVNGVVSLLIVAAALRIASTGTLALLTLGLMPMVLYEFASASPDGAVISTAFLFTAVAVRASARGRWSATDILLACVTGLVFCSLKPVYAPLLVLGLPAAFRPGRTRHVITVHAFLIAIVVGFTILWLSHKTQVTLQTPNGVSGPEQLALIVAHPLSFAWTVLHTVMIDWAGWLFGAIGILGWLSIVLPAAMYAMPLAAVAAGLFSRQADEPGVTPTEAVWRLGLMAMSAMMILLAMYLFFSPVGGDEIFGVQGRYFLPLSALAVLTAAGLRPLSKPGQALSCEMIVLPLVAAEVVLTSLVIVRAYQVV